MRRPNSVLTGASTAFVLQVAGITLGYASNVLLARWLGAQGYGVYAFVVSWVLLLATLSTLGFPTVVQRFIPQYTAVGDAPRTTGVLVLTRILVTGVGLLIALLGSFITLALDRSIQQPYTVPLIVGIWMVPIWANIYLQSGFARARGRMALAFGPPRVLRVVLLITVAAIIVELKILLTSTLALVLALSTLLLTALAQGIVFRLTERQTREYSLPAFEPRLWIGVAMPVLLGAALTRATREAGVLLVGTFLPPGQAGIYSAALRTSRLLFFPATAVNAMIMPMLAIHHAQNNRWELQRLLSTSVAWSFWAASGLAGVLAALSPIILSLFGTEFTSASREAIILTLGTLVKVSLGPMPMLLNVTEHQNEVAKVTGVSAILTVALSAIGIQYWGITAVAIAQAAGMVFETGWLNRVAAKRLNVEASVFYWVFTRLRRARSPQQR